MLFPYLCIWRNLTPRSGGLCLSRDHEDHDRAGATSGPPGGRIRLSSISLSHSLSVADADVAGVSLGQG